MMKSHSKKVSLILFSLAVINNVSKANQNISEGECNSIQGLSDDGLLESCALKYPSKRIATTVKAIEDGLDPALKTMTFDIGQGEEKFLAYVQPDVSTFYREPEGSRKEKKMLFNGFAGKFYNLSPWALTLYWSGGEDTMVIDTIQPFQARGTATFPGHVFYIAPPDNPTNIAKYWEMVPTTTHYVFDPFSGTETLQLSHDALDPDQRKLYDAQKRSLSFAKKYREFTGRDYQSLYPRPMPMHKMWPNEYIGQKHWVETKETHFATIPHKSLLGKITEHGSSRKLSETDPRLMESYRFPGQTLNLTLTSISASPRAFEIENFLSEAEVNYILEAAGGMDLARSTVGSDGLGETATTRTSKNTWVNREESIIVDTLYRRAADLLRIDESLFRYRGEEEYPDLPTKTSIAEPLQLVHYEPGQEYTAHHDWGYPGVENPHQPCRFATLLLYLNDDVVGGETSFPRWVNAETSRELKCYPKKGKAMLFYSVLPDGNMDDLSQHAALPVKKGEKWLMNFWVWDPKK